MLASASGALIIGFNVRAETKALSLADQEKVDIRFYTVIYDAVSDVEDAILGMLKPVYKEVLLDMRRSGRPSACSGWGPSLEAISWTEAGKKRKGKTASRQCRCP